MPRQRRTIHLSVTIPIEQHERLLEIAEEAEATLSDVVRELVAFATKTRSKSAEIRSRLSVDDDDRAS